MNALEDLIQRGKEHEHKLVSHLDAHKALHAGLWFSWFNTKAAVLITRVVATMWCAYAFATLAFVSLPSAIKSGDPVTLISWTSQTFLQLVLLSIIMVGQSVLAEAADQRAETDHETLTLLKDINVAQLEILRELHASSVDIR